MIINNREISTKNKPYLIAEMSGNHGQNFEQAKLIVFDAKKTGADALKLQTYTPDTIILIAVIKTFILMMKIVYGQNNVFMTYITMLIPNGIG